MKSNIVLAVDVTRGSPVQHVSRALDLVRELSQSTRGFCLTRRPGRRLRWTM
jgi:hypothetical protein